MKNIFQFVIGLACLIIGIYFCIHEWTSWVIALRTIFGAFMAVLGLTLIFLIRK